MTTLRVGLVGQRGKAFVSGLRAIPGVDVTALCDLDETRLSRNADELEISGRFTAFSDLLENVDAVVIATPMPLHAPQAIEALDAGVHVLSEVTAAVSIEQCWRLHDAAARSRAVYMLSENYCYQRDCVLVKEMARRGLFGDPYYGEGEYLHDVKSLHHDADGSPTWRAFWQVGQRGSTYPTHSLGPVMQWIKSVHENERIVSVACHGTGARTDPEHPHDDTSLLLCKTNGGRLVKIRLDMMSNRPHQMSYYALQGTRGAYEASRRAGQPGFVWLGGDSANVDDNRQWQPLSDYDDLLPGNYKNPPEDAKRAGHGGGDYFIVTDFVDAIRNGTRPPIDIYDGLEWTAAGLCSQLSIENDGAPIRVPDFRNPAERPVWLDG